MSISIAAYNDGNINGTLLDDWLQNICNSKFWVSVPKIKRPIKTIIEIEIHLSICLG